MIKKAVILVGGLGTRFLPATKAQPKEMLPIVDTPIIQLNVEEAVNSGVGEIIFVTGRNKRAIEDHFDYAGELEEVLRLKKRERDLAEIRRIADLASFSYVRQKRPGGNGDALLAASHLVGEEPFGVLFGDDPIFSRTPALAQLARVFSRVHAPVLGLFRVSKKEVSRYGVIAGKKIGKRLWHITHIIEKPVPERAPSNLSVAGRYVLIPEIFAALGSAIKKIPKGEELTLVDGFNVLLKSGHPIFGYEIDGEYRDCGNKLGFMQTSVLVALNHPEIKKGFRKWIREIARDSTFPKLPGHSR